MPLFINRRRVLVRSEASRSSEYKDTALKGSGKFLRRQFQVLLLNKGNLLLPFRIRTYILPVRHKDKLLQWNRVEGRHLRTQKEIDECLLRPKILIPDSYNELR